MAPPGPARVTTPWRASYRPALAVRRGQPLTVGKTDPDNPGWTWCVDVAGLGGWLPTDAVADGRAREAFDSAELTAAAGTPVTVLAARAGWSLCRSADGRTGWLPATHLDATATMDGPP